MNGAADFVALIRDELGLPLTEDDLRRPLHEIPGWESMHLLWLVAVLEEETGRQISVIDLLEAPCLEFVRELAAGQEVRRAG